jgi:NAD-dependent dihydropyrimidine dehydrogenase PreA subunit
MYVIGQPCIDILDRSCVDVCPVDCIYEGARALYIHPDECIDCGACDPVCPVEAIYEQDAIPADFLVHMTDNAQSWTVAQSRWGHREGLPPWAPLASTPL